MQIWLITLLVGFYSLLQSDLGEAQTRIPGWNRVAPPGGHQNDPQLVRATGGPVVPIFEGWFPTRTVLINSALAILTRTLKRFSIYP